MKCNEKIWVDDVDGDGYAGKVVCGGTYEKIGTTELYQCRECKKVVELKEKISKLDL